MGTWERVGAVGSAARWRTGALVLAVAAVAAGGPPSAAAWELGGLGAVDLLAATGSEAHAGTDGTPTLATLGLSLHAELRRAGPVDGRLDYFGREGLVGLGFADRPGDRGDSSEHELRELSATVHLRRQVDLTLGRVVTPGGFWLILDGARLDLRYAPWVGQSVYAGLRAFTTGRREVHLTADPALLPAAGTSLWARSDWLDAAVTFTYAQDRVELSNQRTPAGRLVLEQHVEDELFLQAQAGVFPHPRAGLFGGVRFGTRYDVHYGGLTSFGGATSLAASTLGSTSAWAEALYRPTDRVRLEYQLAYEHVRLFQSRLISGAAAGASGDFQDHVLRATARIAGDTRGTVAARLRLRDNGDVEYHASVALDGDRLVYGLGVFAGVDVQVTTPVVGHIFFRPDLDPFVRVVYRAGLSYLSDRLEVRAGLHYTEGVGSGLLSSPTSPPAGQDPTTAILFPYVLETNRVAFAQAFLTTRLVFAGLDVEENVDVAELRAMAQVGAAF